jgi:hypothetical protein
MILAGETEPGAPRVPSAELSQIREWVAALDHDSFAEREAATRRLIQAGREAVAPVTEAGLRENLEVTTRATQILVELYKSGDAATADAAELGLEQLLASGQPTATRRAAVAFDLQGACPRSIFTSGSSLRSWRAPSG